MSIRGPMSGPADPFAPKSRPSSTRRQRRPARPVVSIALALIALALVAPSIALAHAELATVAPADMSTVQGSPTQIVMTFVQNLVPANSSIVLVDASGAVIIRGGTVPAGKPREMDLAITTPL